METYLQSSQPCPMYHSLWKGQKYHQKKKPTERFGCQWTHSGQHVTGLVSAVQKHLKGGSGVWVIFSLGLDGAVEEPWLLCEPCQRLCSLWDKDSKTKHCRLIAIFAAKSQEKVILFLQMHRNIWNLQYFFEHGVVSVSSVKSMNFN